MNDATPGPATDNTQPAARPPWELVISAGPATVEVHLEHGEVSAPGDDPMTIDLSASRERFDRAFDALSEGLTSLARLAPTLGPLMNGLGAPPPAPAPAPVPVASKPIVLAGFPDGWPERLTERVWLPIACHAAHEVRRAYRRAVPHMARPIDRDATPSHVDVPWPELSPRDLEEALAEGERAVCTITDDAVAFFGDCEIETIIYLDTFARVMRAIGCGETVTWQPPGERKPIDMGPLGRALVPGWQEDRRVMTIVGFAAFEAQRVYLSNHAGLAPQDDDVAGWSRMPWRELEPAGLELVEDMARRALASPPDREIRTTVGHTARAIFDDTARRVAAALGLGPAQGMT